MDPNSLAEELPALYRAILDRVAELEADGRRVEAARVRSDATRIYSRAWDERARSRLEALLLRNSRPAAGQQLRGHGHGRLRGRRTHPGSAVIS
jgi:hypothetical protein